MQLDLLINSIIPTGMNTHTVIGTRHCLAGGFMFWNIFY